MEMKILQRLSTVGRSAAIALLRGSRWICLVLLAGVLWWNSGAIALAQEPDSDTSSPPAIEESFPTRFNPDASDISSEKVSQFVTAYLKVASLIEQREDELQAAETETDFLQVQREIESEALDMIESVGLTQQEYLQLLGLANSDPEFGERIAIQFQEAMTGNLP